MRYIRGIAWAVALFAAQTPAASAPAVKVVAPNGGELLAVGDTLEVTWVVNPDSIGGRGVTVDVSVDAGRYWIPINTTGALIVPGDTAFFHGDTGVYRWVIPLEIPDPNSGSIPALSDQCLFRVYDPYSDPWEEDRSDGAFTIVADLGTRSPMSHRTTARAPRRGMRLVLPHEPVGDSGARDLRGRRASPRFTVPVTGVLLCP